jgi:hypothetical protein
MKALIDFDISSNAENLVSVISLVVYVLIILVNYPLLKCKGASCFPDKATASSPQALIPTIPAVFLRLINANFFILFAANSSLEC